MNRLLAFLILSCLLAPHGWAGNQPSVAGAYGPGTAASLQVQDLDLPAWDQTQGLLLELPAASHVEAWPAQSDRAAGGRQTIGFGRELGGLDAALKGVAGIPWQRLEDGAQVGRLRVRSAGAAALRLGLDIRRLPAGAELHFSSPEHPAVHRVGSAEILEGIAVTIRSGELSAAARTYWSPVTEGEVLDMAIYLPAGIAPESIDVLAHQISHLTWSPLSNRVAPGQLARKIGGSGSCNLDVMCHAEGDPLRGSVARMVFTSGGNSFLCTGTLLNSGDEQFIPYFLTANHCIENQLEAANLNTFWFYHATACNSGMLNPARQQVSGGAVLLETVPNVDISLLQLNNPAPANAWFAGWDAGLPSNAAATIALHHPAGDLQKISFGSITGFADCGSNPNDLECFFAPLNRSNFLVVTHSQGTTEGGSSGSAIFNDQGQVLGTLLGGGASCETPSEPDLYGRFDLGFASGNLARWLFPEQERFNPGWGGLWFNPAQDGHGFSITFHSDRSASVFWYTYDALGYPMWLLGLGSVVDNRIEAQVYHANGMRFGDWQPSDLTLQEWGSLTISFDSCVEAELEYSGTLVFEGQNFGSGNMPLERLAYTEGVTCAGSPLKQ